MYNRTSYDLFTFPTRIRTSIRTATLYYTETVPIARTRTQILIQILITNYLYLNRDPSPSPANVNKSLRKETLYCNATCY